jgi:hypothetical protein
MSVSKIKLIAEAASYVKFEILASNDHYDYWNELTYFLFDSEEKEKEILDRSCAYKIWRLSVVKHSGEKVSYHDL